jgi:hypothetical protein
MAELKIARVRQPYNDSLFPVHHHTSPSVVGSFSGQPGEQVVRFLYKVQLSINCQSPSFSNEHKMIIYMSSFLHGRALDWFLQLVRRNALAVIAHENALRTQERAERDASRAKEQAAQERARQEGRVFQSRFQRGPVAQEDLVLNDNFPAQWTTYDFVLPELARFNAFVDAFAAAFSDCEEVGTSRSQTPTGSDVTLTWD